MSGGPFFRAVPVFDTLSRDRVGGFPSGAAERPEMLNGGGGLGHLVAATRALRPGWVVLATGSVMRGVSARGLAT